MPSRQATRARFLACCIAAALLIGCAGQSGSQRPSVFDAPPRAALLPLHVGDIERRIARVRDTPAFDNAVVRPLGRASWRSPRDVQPLIQAAIDGLPPDGGTVLLPPGELTIAGPIRITRSDVAIRGAGPDRTLIRYGDLAMQGDVLDAIEIRGPARAEPVRNVHIADLAIDANYWNQPGSYHPRGIDSDNASRLLVENVRVDNAFVGLTFGLGVSDATAFNVTISNWHNDAFNASGDEQDGDDSGR